VGDSVVNQLLSKLDGVDQLNNILLIGMTNRMDMIDEALLRPGRLEVHMEISLPDEKGRAQILKIHTTKMRSNDVLENDVNVDELAKLTKNFSGAELSGLIKAASSFAFARHIKVGTMAAINPDVENMKVTREDFIGALNEVQPLFGAAEEELQKRILRGIIHYSTFIKDILEEGRLYTNQVRKPNSTPILSVALHGPPGSGKTALAAKMAMDSEFPFIKLISPEDMVGFSEMQKVQQLDKTFRDAYKSPLSVIVIDNVEMLVDWVPIGPRFSNSVLVALKVLLDKQPPKVSCELLPKHDLSGVGLIDLGSPPANFRDDDRTFSAHSAGPLQSFRCRDCGTQCQHTARARKHLERVRSFRRSRSTTRYWGNSGNHWQSRNRCGYQEDPHRH
jgi:vesicle-fusing ATPase